jgi:membrane protein DedA with SNARE-associated domain
MDAWLPTCLRLRLPGRVRRDPLEGEAILLLAAYSAHQGIYRSGRHRRRVCGATLGDQIFFFSGRLGDRLLRRLPVIGAKADKINALLPATTRD